MRISKTAGLTLVALLLSIILTLRPTYTSGQQPMPDTLLRVHITSISASRSGLHLNPEIIVTWRTDIGTITAANGTSWHPFTGVGRFDFLVQVQDSSSQKIIDSLRTREFTCHFKKRLRFGKRYQCTVIPLDSPYTWVNPNHINTAYFTILRRRDDNAFMHLVMGAYNLVWTKFWKDFITKGGPLGTVICIIILALFAITIVNLSAFISRMFVRIGRKRDIPRIFPKNEKVNYGAEAKRFISFHGYGDQNEFVQQLVCEIRKGHRSSRYILPSLEKGKYQSILQQALARPFRKYKEIIGGFGRCYKWLARREMEGFFESNLTLTLDSLRGFGEDKKWLSLDGFWWVGVLAPMIGLFGTVLGICRAFGWIQFGSKTARIASDLAGNIQLALNTTILGLIAGIIAIGWYYYFKHQIESLGREIRRIFNMLVRMLNL